MTFHWPYLVKIGDEFWSFVYMIPIIYFSFISIIPHQVHSFLSHLLRDLSNSVYRDSILLHWNPGWVRISPLLKPFSTLCHSYTPPGDILGWKVWDFLGSVQLQFQAGRCVLEGLMGHSSRDCFISWILFRDRENPAWVGFLNLSPTYLVYLTTYPHVLQIQAFGMTTCLS